MRRSFNTRAVAPLIAAVALLAFVSIAAAASAACVGDCDGSNDVTVDEVVTMVLVALAKAPLTTCSAGDADAGGSITVDEIITATTKALDGCDAPPTTAPPTASTPEGSVTLTLTPTETPTAEGTPEPEGTATPEPTGSEIVEPTQTEAPEPTEANGMMPLTQSPAPTATVPPSPTAQASPTHTQAAPTNTPPPAPTAIPTHTSAPPPTAEPPPTSGSLPTHTAAGGVSIDIGSAAGAPGSTVSITVVLSGGGSAITATSNDIIYDSGRVHAVQNGRPVCTINPAIGSGSAVNKTLLTSVAAMSGALERLRVGVIGFSNANAIPDGPLFTCQFEIAADVPPGTIALQNLPSASNAMGDSVPVFGALGTIAVQ